MSDDQIKPTDAVELSDEELEDVAGGFNLRLNAAFFRQTNISTSQETGGYGSSKSTFAAENIESVGLQILITDASAEDLDALSGLLGSATAIDGSD
ncbi:hypothetical protein C7B65_14770 [Phormidesmis priestleyi ULC007]|uniref:Uncharacterized protein n=1 Tax=Phormidesmis priestleyi ULC007 TaxID=1920490 RepID=A0A2T1DDJ7_9CYAN|nr:CTB family bacteriocin [Phormidesmis priestleyi]PSB18558.1 hypothetical protein C7B65_14770 [Phormidesmis priestleyi ULC007]PZO49793.1 MAG: hypothetical protein DCF14_13310 [Phormidesmis priestleyi]